MFLFFFFFFFKQKTAYEIFTRLEFRRVLFRSARGAWRHLPAPRRCPVNFPSAPWNPVGPPAGPPPSGPWQPTPRAARQPSPSGLGWAVLLLFWFSPLSLFVWLAGQLLILAQKRWHWHRFALA